MSVRELVRLLRRHWWLLLLGLLLGGCAAFAVTVVMTPLYQAETRLFVSTQSAQSNADLLQGGNFTQQRMQSYADVASSPRVLDPVIRQLGLKESASGLAKRVTADAPADTVMLVISASDTSAARAAAIADATASSLASTIEALEAPASGGSPVRATIVQPAVAPSAPITPNVPRNIALGLILGGLVGLGIALLRHTLDTRVRTAEDLKSITAATLLGAVPFDKSAVDQVILSQEDPHSLRAEALRKVRTNLQFVDIATHPKSIVVTSCLPGEGKSSTSANLSITMAEAGLNVCLIEGDLRRPKVIDYLGLEGGAGLTTVLIGDADLDDVLQPWGGVSVGAVDVLATGPLPPNPSELLGSKLMRNLLEELESRYDMVLIDAPPLLPVTDAAVLSTAADGVILIVGSGKVDSKGLMRGLESLETVDAKLLGMVMNRVSVSKRSSYYGYGYSYEGYGANSAEEEFLSRRSGGTRTSSRGELPDDQASYPRSTIDLSDGYLGDEQAADWTQSGDDFDRDIIQDPHLGSQTNPR